MKSRCRRQGDLFEERTTVLDLDPGLRAKLAPLLQILMTEAACGGSEANAPCGAEGGDDADHA